MIPLAGLLSPEDLLSIQQVINSYAIALDDHDWDGVRACYHDDATDDRGAYVGGPDDLVEWIRGRHESIRRSSHLIGNIVVRGKGRDVAFAESRCWLAQDLLEDATEPPDTFRDYLESHPQSKGEALRLTGICRYSDQMEKIDGRWAIMHRRVVVDWMMIERSAQNLVPNSPWNVPGSS